MASESKTTAKALLARNPVTFECIRGREESIALLAKATSGGEVEPRDSLRGTVTPELVTLRYGPVGSGPTSRTHFHGRWESDATGVRLVGEIRPGSSSTLAMAFLSLGMSACLVGGLVRALAAGWTDPLAILALAVSGIAMFLFPVVVVGMGSTRIAAEIEIVRAIGSAIGDPEKYATPKWRRWKPDD